MGPAFLLDEKVSGWLPISQLGILMCTERGVSIYSSNPRFNTYPSSASFRSSLIPDPLSRTQPGGISFMPGISNTAEDSSRGGLGVVVFVFFIVSFALSVGAQILLDRLGERDSKQTASEEVVIAKDLVQPSSDFPPEKVVALQMEGLADTANSAGIQQCFVFASPSNKQMTGPLTRFAAMLHQSPYNALLDHEVILIGKPVVKGESANVVVTVLDNRDEIHVFQFLLSKQHGKDVENCWMTDAVFPLQPIPANSPVEHPTASHSEFDIFVCVEGSRDQRRGCGKLAPHRGRHG